MVDLHIGYSFCRPTLVPVRVQMRVWGLKRVLQTSNDGGLCYRRRHQSLFVLF